MTSTSRTLRRLPLSMPLLLVLLVLVSQAVGSHASALPFSRSSLTTIAKTQQECVTLQQNNHCDVDIFSTLRGGALDKDTPPRGGSSTTAAVEVFNWVESLKLVGLVGAVATFRQAVKGAAQDWWKDAYTAKFLLAGAVAGIVSRTAVSPLEVVATAQMVRGGNKGMVAELSELLKNEGVKGFFKGNFANCLKVAPTRGVQFFAFESFKKRLVEYKRAKMGLSPDDATNVALTPLERLIAGGFAGMIASSMVYPIEVVKTMLTMYPGKYAGIGAAFSGVLREVGPKGLYAGLAPTLIAMFPYVGVEFMIYETCKLAMEAIWDKRQLENADGTKKTLTGPPKALPIILSLGLGALAGAAAQTSAHPLDVVRKRLQVQGINGNPVLYKNTLDCFAGVAKKEGFKTLYKGLGPACVATIPGTGIAYITYEFMKKFLQLTSV